MSASSQKSVPGAKTTTEKNTNITENVVRNVGPLPLKRNDRQRFKNKIALWMHSPIWPGAHTAPFVFVFAPR